MSRTVVAALAFTVLVFGFTVPALANSIPLQSPGSVSGVLVSALDPVVTVVGQDLSISIHRPHGMPSGTAVVRTRYTLALVDGAGAQIVPVAFVVDGHAGSWEVELDGESLASEPTGPVRVEGLDLVRSHLDPLTGEAYAVDLRDAGARGEITALLFNLQLKPGRPHDLTVSYSGYMGWDRRRYFNPIYHMTYFLSPAARWAGYGGLSLSITTPPGFRVATSLDDHLEETAPGVLEGIFSELPGDELHISTISGTGIWPGLATRGQAASVWLAGVVLYVGTLVLVRARPARALAGLPLAILSVWLFTRNLWHYPLSLLQIPVLVLICLAVLITSDVSLRRRAS